MQEASPHPTRTTLTQTNPRFTLKTMLPENPTLRFRRSYDISNQVTKFRGSEAALIPGERSRILTIPCL